MLVVKQFSKITKIPQNFSDNVDFVLIFSSHYTAYFTAPQVSVWKSLPVKILPDQSRTFKGDEKTSGR